MVGNGSLRVQLPGKRLILLSGPALNPQGGDLGWVWCSPLEPSTVLGIIGYCRNVTTGSPTTVPIRASAFVRAKDASWSQRRTGLGGLSACFGMSDPHCHGGDGVQRKRDISEKGVLLGKGGAGQPLQQILHKIYFNLEKQNWGRVFVAPKHKFIQKWLLDCLFLCSGWLGAGFTQDQAWATPSWIITDVTSFSPQS